MRKKVVAIRPFDLHDSNFKIPIYEEFVKAGGKGIESRPLEKYYRSFAFHIDLPTLWQNEREARLRFVEGASLRFDTFPDYITYEVIPMFWDCWPRFWKATERFFLKHKVRTAFFTSSQTAEHFRTVFPNMNIFYIPEGIDTHKYDAGRALVDRGIDYLEYGRCGHSIDCKKLDPALTIVSTRIDPHRFPSRESLFAALADSKIVIVQTRNDNQPHIAEGIDTLTQRYWENMLSRNVMLGRAPQELIDLIGYNPTIPLDEDNYPSQIKDVIAHISDYQELVDKNREVALRCGDWAVRARKIYDILNKLDFYCI